MKFIHLSDPHLLAPGERLFGLDPLQRLRACLDDIARHHGDAVFCVITGDLTDTGEMAAYEALQALVDTAPLPVYLTLGNHDRREMFARVFDADHLDTDGFVQRSVPLETGYALLLDTAQAGRGSGRLEPVQLAWLDRELEKTGGAPVYLFMHHPPLPVGMKHFDAILLEEPDGFFEILHRHGNIRHIFFGHVHLNMSGAFRGIPFSCNSGCCHHIALDFMATEEATFVDDRPCYSVITLQEQSVLVHFEHFQHLLPVSRAGVSERAVS